MRRRRLGVIGGSLLVTAIVASGFFGIKFTWADPPVWSYPTADQPSPPWTAVGSASHWDNVNDPLFLADQTTYNWTTTAGSEESYFVNMNSGAPTGNAIIPDGSIIRGINCTVAAGKYHYLFTSQIRAFFIWDNGSPVYGPTDCYPSSTNPADTSCGSTGFANFTSLALTKQSGSTLRIGIKNVLGGATGVKLSQIACFISRDEPALPGTGLTATYSGSPRKANLLWTDPTTTNDPLQEDGWIVERGTNGANYVQIKTLPAGNGGTISTDDLTPTPLPSPVALDTRFSYRVIATRNTGAKSAPSNVAEVTYGGRPSNFSCSVTGQNRKLTCSWADNSTDEDVTGGFKIYRRNGTCSSGAGSVVAATENRDAEQKEFTQFPLAAGSYCYYIKAKAGALESDEDTSNRYPITVPAAPLTPTGFSAVYTTMPGNPNRWAHIIWNDVANETNYVLQRDIGDGNGFQDLITLPAGTVMHDDNIPSGIQVPVQREYLYRIKAYGLGGDSAYTSASTVPDIGRPSNFQATVDPNTRYTHYSWTDNSNNETGFQREYRLGACTPGSAGYMDFSPTLGPNATTAPVFTGGMGQTRCYRIMALEGSNRSDPSNGSSVTP